MSRATSILSLKEKERRGDLVKGQWGGDKQTMVNGPIVKGEKNPGRDGS